MVDEEIFALLLARVEETRKSYEEAKKRFWRIAGKPQQPDAPDGVPHARDDEPRRASIVQENSTLQAHIQAMMELNRYLLDGTVPDDMPPKSKEERSEHST